MKQTIVEAQSAARILRHFLQPNMFQIIAIAGRLGSGKTTLAKHLSRELDIQRLTLDDFLDEKCVGPNLRNVIDEVDRLAKSCLPVVIEGVGVLSTLKEISYEYDLLVYIERPCSKTEGLRDDFYTDNTIVEPAINIIGVYDDQDQARQLANLIVIRSS